MACINSCWICGYQAVNSDICSDCSTIVLKYHKHGLFADPKDVCKQVITARCKQNMENARSNVQLIRQKTRQKAEPSFNKCLAGIG